MKSNPLVSVVIPTHNLEKTLAKCLKSIKNQTHKSIEIIVVRTWSKDGKDNKKKTQSVNALEYSKNFNWDKVAQEFEKILKETATNEVFKTEMILNKF